MWWHSGQSTCLLHQMAQCSIPGKGKNQNIERSPVNPAVKWVLSPFGAEKDYIMLPTLPFYVPRLTFSVCVGLR